MDRGQLSVDALQAEWREQLERNERSDVCACIAREGLVTDNLGRLNRCATRHRRIQG